MSSVCVGNDIVDLANPRTEGRSADERFVARVFAAEEQEAVRASGEPDLEVWCHWAAKEAGYKAISKLVGAPPPFVHRTFVVRWSGKRGVGAAVTSDEASAPVIRRGVVSWRERSAEVTVALHPAGVHAVAHASRRRSERPTCIVPRVALLDAPSSPWSGTLEELMPRFSEREAEAVYSIASAAVRVGARRELAELLDVPERRLEIVCGPGPMSQRPPRVLLDGRDVEADVSLSHDGPLIAWALWVGIDPATRSS